MTMAQSPALIELDNLVRASGFPEDPTALSELTTIQQRQYNWFMRADRFRIENYLYQQVLGILDFDSASLYRARQIILHHEALDQEYAIERLKQLVAQVEQMQE